MGRVKGLWMDSIDRHYDSFMEGDLDEDAFAIEMFRLNVPEETIDMAIADRRNKIDEEEAARIMKRGMG